MNQESVIALLREFYEAVRDERVAFDGACHLRVKGAARRSLQKKAWARRIQAQTAVEQFLSSHDE
jgi:hypothetical protein